MWLIRWWCGCIYQVLIGVCMLQRSAVWITGLLEINVCVLTTCHTQYTSDSSICIFLFNRTTLPVFVTYRTVALYVYPLWFYKHQHDNPVRSKLSVACQRWWFQWRFWFVPSVLMFVESQRVHILSTYKVCNKNLKFCSTK